MELKLFSEDDFCTLREFMTPIWRETYHGVIPDAQIEFLIDKYFSNEGIKHFRAQGYVYYKLTDGKLKGVTVICEKDGCTYLDKLYLTKESRGKGYASFVFGELLKLGRDITLNVNQGNARAIACYKKNGFKVTDEERIPLENGMVNIDYKMLLTKEDFYSH